MIARASGWGRRRVVTLEMPLEEFREHVEWLETMALGDGCTESWRAQLDHVDPPEDDDAGLP
jgi:hypothetical protein